MHEAAADGTPLQRKKLTRGTIESYLDKKAACLVEVEACSEAHHFGRKFQQLGLEVKLIPPIYVKPFVKRQTNDENDAEAIVEAAQRPTMRFVAVKSEEDQAKAMVYRTRALLIRQRTQTVNCVRGLLAEFGIVVAHGFASVLTLEQEVEVCAEALPEAVAEMAAVLFEQIAALNTKIDTLEKEIKAAARADEKMKQLMQIPGVGPIGATAVCAFAPPMATFRRGRDFAAWAGLTPRQHSTAGRQRLGRITKMGQKDIRYLLVLGATAVIRHARRQKEIPDPWLRRMLAEKPPKLVATALANKMAPMIWVLSVTGEDYRPRRASA